MRQSISRQRLAASLRSALGAAICEALDDPAVVEIMVNPDGRVYLERSGQGTRWAASLGPEDRELVITRVAHALSTTANADRPIISGVLPIGGHRFEGIIAPAAPSAMFTIRKRASAVFSLGDYIGSGSMTEVEAAIIRRAISERQNIVVSGGTGSGKTTLCNAILAEFVTLAPQDRLVILEDTAEIQCLVENHLSLVTTDAVKLSGLLRSTMRLRPDRIIVGEVRDGAALTLLKAWNTGHPGGVTSLHANSALSALTRIEQLIAEASMQPMPQIIGEAVDLVIAVARTPKGRVVREIMSVEGFSGGQYLTRTLSQRPRSQSQGSYNAA